MPTGRDLTDITSRWSIGISLFFGLLAIAQGITVLDRGETAWGVPVLLVGAALIVQGVRGLIARRRSV